MPGHDITPTARTSLQVFNDPDAKLKIDRERDTDCPVLVAVLALATVAIATPIAWAGSPHFSNNAFSITREDNSLTVSGKEAGLGHEAQVHVVVSATAL